jgi:predicted nucleic acid-binding protein
MIILDTNVVSELMRPAPEENVVSWVDRYSADDVFITAVTAAELQYGVARLPDSHRKTVLTTKVAELLTEDFQDQILPFGGDEAAYYAKIAAAREHWGRPMSMADAQIAAICLRYYAELATRNMKDFVGIGVRVRDPWDDTVAPM